MVLDETNIFWRGCIERPDRFKDWSSPFVNLEEALAWVETELPSPRKTTKEPGSLKAKSAAEHPGKETRSPIDLTPYWIEPADLEPTRLSFRVIIDLDHAPDSFKTMEMSFGKPYRYNEKFPSTAQVVRELRLDPALITIEQVLGPDDDWYRIHSTAEYYEIEVASAQSQRLWSQSLVHSLYKEGKIRRARYGVEEQETRFSRWLGGLDDPEQPWSQASSREKHMSELAMRETLAYALDVVGFREYLGFSPDESSDDELLKRLHEMRALSRYVPEHAKAESARWFKEHGEKKQVVS